jgi:hypothetical protein
MAGACVVKLLKMCFVYLHAKDALRANKGLKIRAYSCVINTQK